MTNNIWVTADLHFGHKKVQEIRGITDDDLVERWNQVVGKRDVVYVLGDVFKLDRVPDLRGYKKLVMGNHDLAPMKRYLLHFTQVRAYYVFSKDVLLSHIPVHPSQRGRYRLNVHGHTHSHRIMGAPGLDGITRPHDFYRCVSVEQTDYRPVLLRDVIR